MIDLADFALRPVRTEDSVRMLRWRNDERIRAQMYTDHPISQEEHTAWFARMLQDNGRDYRIAERRGRPIGVVALTAIDERSRRASWAFYVGEREVPPGCGAAMEYLALEHAFGARGLHKLCCEVLVSNVRVIKQHKRFGFRQEGLLVDQVTKNGRYEDVVLLAMFEADWPSVRENLLTKLFGRHEVRKGEDG